jgi:hypothetical protein
VIAGSGVTITWTSSGSSCTASGGWSGGKAASGSEVVTVSATTNFALACTGAGGTANKSVTVFSVVAEPFDQLQGRLKTLFTKDQFETTATFLARAADELNQQKTYIGISTADTYNTYYGSYNADLQELTVFFSFTCRTGNGGQVCAPANAIGLAQGVRGGNSGLKQTWETVSVLKLANPPPQYATGFKLRVDATAAQEIVSGMPRLLVKFRLPFGLPVDTAITDKIVPTEIITYTESSGWRYTYTWPAVVAGTLLSVSFVSRSSGNTLATLTF